MTMIKKEMTVWQAKNEVNKYDLSTVEQCDEYIKVMCWYYGKKEFTGQELLNSLNESNKSLMELDLSLVPKEVIKTVHESKEAMTNQIIRLEKALYRINVEQA